MASVIAIRTIIKTKEVHSLHVPRLGHVSERYEFSTVLSGGRLFQHYLVDQFCKKEAERLSYLLQNQQSLRAGTYTALRELLGNSTVRKVGCASFYLYWWGALHALKMHDIIATSNKIGHPEMFLALTCNSDWP